LVTVLVFTPVAVLVAVTLTPGILASLGVLNQSGNRPDRLSEGTARKADEPQQ
jgi:hypothetical protein